MKENPKLTITFPKLEITTNSISYDAHNYINFYIINEHMAIYFVQFQKLQIHIMFIYTPEIVMHTHTHCLPLSPL